MADPARPGIRAGQAIALTVFTLTALLLVALAVAALAAGAADVRRVALVLSTFAAAAACVTMLVDGVDMWVLGRRLSPSAIRVTRTVVFACVLAGLGLTLIGRNTALFLIMAPSLFIYLFAVTWPRQQTTFRSPRRRPQPAARGKQRRGGRRRP